MSRAFYNHTKEALAEMDALLSTLESADSMAVISRTEVGIRKKAEEIMVYAGMIPNKDAALISYGRRKTIRENAISGTDRVREILAKEEAKEEQQGDRLGWLIDKPVDEPAEKKAIAEKAKKGGKRAKKGKKNGNK